jgi:MoaA/NifB/PqqE/SkfB family radical SAM enzyme
MSSDQFPASSPHLQVSKALEALIASTRCLEVSVKECRALVSEVRQEVAGCGLTSNGETLRGLEQDRVYVYGGLPWVLREGHEGIRHELSGLKKAVQSIRNMPEKRLPPHVFWSTWGSIE